MKKTNKATHRVISQSRQVTSLPRSVLSIVTGSAGDNKPPPIDDSLTAQKSQSTMG